MDQPSAKAGAAPLFAPKPHPIPSITGRMWTNGAGRLFSHQQQQQKENMSQPECQDQGFRVMLSLDDCIIPDDRLSPTPSQKHGLSPDQETELRMLGCELIQSSGILLRLPQVAMATGQVLFQRFYYAESLIKYDMETTSKACIALASKIEEAPRRLRDVINVFHELKQRRCHPGDHGRQIKPLPLDHEYIRVKNQVIKAERRLLKLLGFCVHVKHPHKLIVSLLHVMGLEANKKVVQTSWNYMNDCLRTDVFCRYSADTIAVSCIYLSTRVLRIALPVIPAPESRVPAEKSWVKILAIDEEQVRAVCRQILSIYTRPKANWSRLEEEIRRLRDPAKASQASDKEPGKESVT